jgi:hypothetical protein
MPGATENAKKVMPFSSVIAPSRRVSGTPHGVHVSGSNCEGLVRSCDGGFVS